MKRIAALLLLPLAFSQCTWLQGHHDPATANPVIIKERWEGRERERTAYEDGTADGAADAGRGAANDYRSHSGKFDPQTEQAYRDGYREGYSQASASSHKSTLTAAQQAAHDTGYAAGLRDRRMNRGADPDQHAGTYDAKLSSWFLDGYQEGFEGR